MKLLARPVHGSVAIGVLNKDDNGVPIRYKLCMSDIGFTNPGGYNLTEAFDNSNMGVVKLKDQFTISVPPTSIFLFVAVPL